MEAYQCDDLGFFVGMVECQRNPMKMGQFLIPKNATVSCKPDDCNWYDFEKREWFFKEEIEPEPEHNSIEVVIEGSPTRDQIKTVISQLLNML